MPTLLTLGGMLATFVAAWAIATIMYNHADRLLLVQAPNERSSHVVPTPSGGGVGIAVPGILAGIVVYANTQFAWVTLAVTALASLIGLLDDRFDISSRLRLALHCLIVGALLVSVGPLPPLQTPWGSLPVPLLYLLMALAGVWWVNLFNFMDGIDGIAGSEAILVGAGALLVAALGGKLAGTDPTLAWALTIITACLGFLIVNWPPAKIFMGDAGSNFLAVAILAILLRLLADGGISYASLLILPGLFVADATTTLLRRIANGQKWFAAHRLHAYQKLSRRWQSHLYVTLLCIAINLLWLLPLAVLAERMSHWWFAVVVLAYAPLVVSCLTLGAGRIEAPGELSKSQS